MNLASWFREILGSIFIRSLSVFLHTIFLSNVRLFTFKPTELVPLFSPNRKWYIFKSASTFLSKYYFVLKEKSSWRIHKEEIRPRNLLKKRTILKEQSLHSLHISVQKHHQGKKSTQKTFLFLSKEIKQNRSLWISVIKDLLSSPPKPLTLFNSKPLQRSQKRKKEI